MIYPQVIDYIKVSLANKMPIEQIKKSLIEKGWRESDVDEAIARVTFSEPKKSLPISKPAGKKLPPYLIFIPIGIILFILLISFIVFLVLKGHGKISSEDLVQGAVVNLGEGKEIKFNLDDEEHKITVDSIQGNSVDVTLFSTIVRLTLRIGVEEKVDIDSDDVYDLLIKLVSVSDGKAEIYVKEISEAICTEDWLCDDWSSCVNSKQKRNCTDQNNCGTEESRPIEIQECIVLNCEAQGGTYCEIYEECNGTLDGDCCLNNCIRISVTDCENNATCLIDAAKVCHPANLTYSVSSSNSTIAEIIYLYEVEGYGSEEEKDAEECPFYMKILDVEGNFSSAQWEILLATYTVEQIEAMIDEIHDSLIGSYEECTFSVSDLKNYIGEIEKGNYELTASELSDYECTGDLYS